MTNLEPTCLQNLEKLEPDQMLCYVVSHFPKLILESHWENCPAERRFIFGYWFTQVLGNFWKCVLSCLINWWKDMEELAGFLLGTVICSHPGLQLLLCIPATRASMWIWKYQTKASALAMFPLRFIRFTGAGALPVLIECMCMCVCTQAHVQISVCTYVSVSLLNRNPLLFKC